MDAEKLIEEYKEYAKSKGFKLNPNEQFVQSIVKGLIMNENKYGAKYCPCRRISGNAEEDKKNICPCVFHEDEIAKNDKCHCMLFFKGD